MNFQKCVSAALVILLAATAMQAEVVSGRWEKVEALPPGTAIVVDIQGGERMECTFRRIGHGEILFAEIDGKERRLPQNTVLKIESAAVTRDRLGNGILIGALVGSIAGVGGMLAYGSAKTNGPVAWGDEDGPSFLLGSALAGGGIGAATGAAIDASIHHREVLFRAK